ncbi:glycosyltransferase [Streptomyces sp. B-S-A8]|uniref:Glycosyltransferase n=1 Tax=Streptomyces solicavernae TaxID=3043614 RepID=A0ABT6RVJ8_9ACTN|nr:glycosyltransferase [Streptomyces sp. B-S-A8]MDI3388473.1 glycosyltransferase [Streptomyces sp. B-S-A8]
MKTLHVITGLGIGGAEQQLRLLLRHLPARSDVVALTNPGPVAGQLRDDGVQVTHLGMRGNRDLRAVPKLARIIARGNYDLVHTHLYRACVYGRSAARLAGVPAIATEHSLGRHHIEGRPLSRGNRALYLLTERLGHGTVAVSETVAMRLRKWGVPDRRIHVVPNGIDAAQFRYCEDRRRQTRARLAIAPDTFVVGAVGRLVPGKRFELLLRAMAETPGAHLLLVGDGPERQSLERLALELGITDRVHLPGACGLDGRVLNIPGLLAAMDVFVSTSREEAFGLAVVEALAAGLPVLHTACPALEDLPAEHTTGAVRVSSHPTLLARELTRYGRAGTRRIPPPAAVGHYDISHSADRLMHIYDAILRRTSSRS